MKAIIQSGALVLACIGQAAYTPIKVEEIEDEGQRSFRITTPSAVWIYHQTGAGFSSLIDNSGNDWIDYHPEGKSWGHYRGIPNLIYRRGRSNEGYFHPGHEGSKASESRIVERNRDNIVIQSRSQDGLWNCEWEIRPDRAVFRLLEKPSNEDSGYWFLYEGTPGGSFNSDDLCLRADGTITPLSESWEGNSSQIPWTAFISPSTGHSLLIISHRIPEVEVSYRPKDNAMTVFGYGRKLKDLENLLYTPTVFTVALIDDIDPKSITEIAESMSGSL